MKLFSGSANPVLSKQVAQYLKAPLAKSEVVRFGNSEVRVRIDEPVKNTPCVVIQPTSNPTDTNLMELFFFCDSLIRQEASKVIGVIPYFGYARQDVQHRPGECVSANVIIHFLESIGFSKIYTINLHDEATEGVFAIPFKNISALSLLVDEVRKYLSIKKISELRQQVAVVSPDQGGIGRAREFEDYLLNEGEHSSNIPLVVIEKRRSLNKIHRSEALALYGDVKNKTVILIDDIITSGGTLIHAAELCLNKGAKKVLAAIVHHDLSDNAPLKLQSSPIERFFTTNTIALKEEQKFKKLQEISVSSLIAEELK